MPSNHRIPTYTKNEITAWEIPNYWDAMALVLVFALVMMLAWSARQMVAPYHLGENLAISLNPLNLPHYALRTILRLFIALTASLVFTFIVGTAAAKSKHAERVIIPLIDILQSIPVLSFLSITMVGFIALFRGSMLGPECAAIFAIFTSQVWNMTLSFYQSMRTVPHDLKEASDIFQLSKWQRFWRIEVPFAMPNLLWNMMMSMSGSWFFVTASEAFSVANQNISLPGIGSYIALAITQANTHAVIFAIFTMFVVIFLYDQLLFRPLVYWSEKFKASQENDVEITRSLVVSMFQRTKFLRSTAAWFSALGDLFVNPLRWRSKKLATVSVARVHEHKVAVVCYYTLLGAVVVVALGFAGYFVWNSFSIGEIRNVFLMGLYTATRVMVLIFLSSLLWVPIGVWIGLRPRVAVTVQPIIQFLAAFPTNLFFPIAAMLFLKYQLNTEIWVAPLMVLGTQWYILFNVIAGASGISKDVKQAAAMLKVTGWLRWRKLILPSVAPSYITGAITAAGGAWNASIIAEVINWGSIKLRATGVGAYIAQNFAVGNYAGVALGTLVMCVFVLVINRFFWRPLYNIAIERYEIEG